LQKFAFYQNTPGFSWPNEEKTVILHRIIPLVMYRVKSRMRIIDRLPILTNQIIIKTNETEKTFRGSIAAHGRSGAGFSTGHDTAAG
jgi:hypothetical protein